MSVWRNTLSPAQTNVNGIATTTSSAKEPAPVASSREVPFLRTIRGLELMHPRAAVIRFAEARGARDLAREHLHLEVA